MQLFTGGEELIDILDICLLGTGGMMPLPYRWLTSLMARYNGIGILIDCGEGTQIAMKEKGWSPKPIDIMCFTHYHADHISGLPGMLLTMGNAEKTTPLTMIGPKGLSRVVNALRVVAPELPFEIKFIEITDTEQRFDFDGFRIEAFRVNHNVTCYGYNIVIDRKGKFNLENALALGLDRKYWGVLQRGEVVELDGKTYTPQMVMGEERKGLKVTYCTDTRPTEGIIKNAKYADLFICEGMYGEPDKLDKAKEYKHMTYYEAATLASKANVSKMWLTHYSPSLTRPEEYKKEVQAIFPRTYIAKDGQSEELMFED
jgi:ribonuclease Z